MKVMGPPLAAPEGYGVEHGELLFAVQMLLVREEQRAEGALRREARVPRLLPAVEVPLGVVREPARGVQAPSQTIAPRLQEPVRGPQVAPSPRPAASVAPAAPRPAAPRPAVAPDPSPKVTAQSVPSRGWSGADMVDPVTRVGTLRALRRDAMLERSWPTSDGPSASFAAIRVDPLKKIRLTHGTERADRILAALAEVAPFVLRPRDRLYRVSEDQMACLLWGPFEDVGEPVQARLQQALDRVLGDRSLPEVTLRLHVIDREALGRRDSNAQVEPAARVPA
jgi:GGDEF domain-containing protein